MQRGRLAGVQLKSPFSEIYTPDQSFTHAKHGYKIDPKKVRSPEFATSWQAGVFVAMDDGRCASESALWLDAERKTFKRLVKLTRLKICADTATIEPWVDDLFVLSGAAFADSVSAAKLGVWLSAQIPVLSGVTPAFLAVFVVIITRMGLRRFCAWAKYVESSDESSAADGRD